MMQYRELMGNCFAYAFTYGSMSIDVLGLYESDQVLFVDAGFKPHGDILRDWAVDKGFRGFEVILSHLHKDHYQGALSIAPQVLLGPSLLDHQMPEELKPLLSVYKNWTDETYTFQGHLMSHRMVGGHSGCSQLIVLDNQLLHVGDLLILDSRGQFSLPLVMGRVEDYNHALQMIIDKKLDGFLGHGGYLPHKKLVYGAELTLDYLHELMQPSCSPEVDDLKVMKHYQYSNAKYHAFNWRYHRGKTHV